MQKLFGRFFTVAASVLVFAGPAVATTLPPLSDFVVFGVTKVKVGDDSLITEGDVGVDLQNSRSVPTSLQFGNTVFMSDGSVIVSDVCKTGPNTSVSSLLFNSGTCSSLTAPNGLRQPPASTFTPPVLTTVPTLPTFPNLPTSPNPTFSGSPPNCHGTLPRGAYGDVSVPEKCVLDLTVQGSFSDPTGADYEFASLSIKKFAKVLVDAPATINIKGSSAGSLLVGEFGNFGPARGLATTPAPRQILVNVGTTQIVNFNAATDVGMQLNAPLAQINLQRATRGRGQFVGDYVNGEDTLILRAAKTAVGPVGNTFTTLTQEDYGQPNAGPANDPATGLVTLHPEVLAVAVVGAPGVRSVRVPDQTALACFLPTAGTATALCAPANVNACGITPQFMSVTDTCSNVGAAIPYNPNPGSSQCLDPTGCSGGQGSGTLAGETIAAKLNVQLSTLGAFGADRTGLGDFILPVPVCTGSNCVANLCTATNCPTGRSLDTTGMMWQGLAAGIENGQMTVNDLIAMADQILSADCGSAGSCTNTCGTAFAPPDPIRVCDVAGALDAVNGCFHGGDTLIPCPAP